MPGATILSLATHDTDENDPEDLELAEKIPLVLPSQVEAARRNALCLHQVAEYERQLRLAQLKDSLIELRRTRRIRYTLIIKHWVQAVGQGQRTNTRSRGIIGNIEERISKFVQRYRAARKALVQLDPTGEWQGTYLELKDEDNRGPGKEDHEQGPGDGSYTISWIWLLNPRVHDTDESNVGGGGGVASDEEVNDEMRVQWTTARARLERWAEEVELLQEEMRRVATFLEWKAETWLAKQDARSTTASPSVQSGLRAYTRKQAAIHRGLAVSFSKLWYPILAKHNLETSWITNYMEKRGISLPGTSNPTPRAQGAEVGEGSTRIGTTPLLQSQDPSDITMDDNTTLLEEVPYIEDDDEGEGDYSDTWDSPNHSDFDGDGNDNNSDDNDSDFDLDFD